MSLFRIILPSREKCLITLLQYVLHLLSRVEIEIGSLEVILVDVEVLRCESRAFPVMPSISFSSHLPIMPASLLDNGLRTGRG